MARPQTGAVLRRIHVLFQAEGLSGLSDRQLLERFLTGRDDGVGARIHGARSAAREDGPGGLQADPERCR